MKNAQLWKPSRFIKTTDGCKACRSSNHIGSLFIMDIVAQVYEEAIRQHARGLLLDLGCGKIPLYEIYRDYVSDSVCVDWANTPHKNPNLDYEFDLNQEVPLPDGYFDTILITDVLEHISSPDILWREMSRMLKPEGKIILGVPFFYWIHEEPYDYYRYTEYKLRMFCEDNGLMVVSLEPYGGFLEIIVDLVAKRIAFHRRLSKIHLFWSNVFIGSSIGRKFSSKTDRKFPLGYCLIAQKLER